MGNARVANTTTPSHWQKNQHGIADTRNQEPEHAQSAELSCQSLNTNTSSSVLTAKVRLRESMAEYIVSGPSSSERLEAAGMEVIVRCKDCKWFGFIPAFRKAGFCFKRYDDGCDNIFVGVNDYCCWGELKELTNGRA